MPADLADAARRIADEVLWPAALEVDSAERVPVALLDRLADAGLYGVAERQPEAFPAVAEALAGASLATAFVWVQHHSTVRAVAAAGGELAERWLGPLCDGRLRSGIAIAALRRPGAPTMVAAEAEGGLVLDGSAPWVTGWGLIDVVLVAARVGDDLVTCLVDAVPGPTLEVERVRLAAVDASSTVTMRLRRHLVPAERVVQRLAYADWRAGDRRALAGNGLLAVGLVARCARLLESHDLRQEVDDLRRQLLATNGTDEVVAVRAELSVLAVRATTALVVAGGGRSVERGDHAQRLLREAMFLLVFGQTADIRAAQRELLAL